MRRLSIFVALQMLTTMALVFFFSLIICLFIDNKGLILLSSTIYLTAAFACGIVPCFIGALVNSSKITKIKNFKLKSFLSWLISFVLTLVVCLLGGIFAARSEVLGRLVLITIPAVISLTTWIHYSNKYLKD